VCCIRFVEEAPDRSQEFPYRTARDEPLVANLDSEGRIVSIHRETRGFAGTDVAIDPSVCYIRFVDARPTYSEELPFSTARDEWLVADFDEANRIIGLELIGSGKPCQ
jgi:hypothetical protein